MQPIGYITHPAPEPALQFDDWVTGSIIANPFCEGPDEATRLPVPAALQMLRDCEVLVCDLRHHHPRDEHRYAYRLDGFEHAWTSDAMVCRVIADWERIDPDWAQTDAASQTHRVVEPSASASLPRAGNTSG